MTGDSIFIYSDKLLTYRFSDQHPFNQLRLALTLDLLKESETITEQQIIQPRIATEDELLLNHDLAFIEAVKHAGTATLASKIAESFGLGTEDNPIFPHMHEASALLVGGTLTAVDYVMEGKAQHALHLGGGLHHGFKGKASGFCIYNDCSVAIKYIQKKYDAKVLYVDTDAHHGDGVQWSFYDDDSVCTLSIHETGRYLFPGTGNTNEWGHGKGYGYSFNVPVDAFTEDDSFIECYSTVFQEIAEYFKPDVIITQNGADAHYFDPLTHLSVTMDTYRQIPKLAHELAHKYCNGRWIAVGGGGYDIWRVVPRAWSLIWHEMTGQTSASEDLIPTTWLKRWQPISPVSLPKTWRDPSDLYQPIPRKNEITEKNRHAVERTLYYIRKREKN